MAIDVRRLFFVPPAIFLGVVFLTSCGYDGTSGSGNGGSSQRAVGHIDVSRTIAYRSISQLARDSSALVEFTATPNAVTDLVGPAQVPFTVQRVSIQSVLSGQISGAIIKVRQPGGESNGILYQYDVPLIQSGVHYAAFVQPFSWGPGRPTDEYVVTGGGAGLFSVSGSVFTRLDPESVALPSTLTLQELLRQEGG
jgi:hypothetical protein